MKKVKRVVNVLCDSYEDAKQLVLELVKNKVTVHFHFSGDLHIDGNAQINQVISECRELVLDNRQSEQ